jgi:hypothetical protein
MPHVCPGFTQLVNFLFATHCGVTFSTVFSTVSDAVSVDHERPKLAAAAHHQQQQDGSNETYGFAAWSMRAALAQAAVMQHTTCCGCVMSHITV